MRGCADGCFDDVTVQLGGCSPVGHASEMLVLIQSGCLVVNAPTANTIAAAEHGIALIAALSRNVAQADASVKAGKWERTKFVGVSIVGKTLAIMGFGKASLTAIRADGICNICIKRHGLFEFSVSDLHSLAQ